MEEQARDKVTVTIQEMKVKGNQLVDKVRDVIEEGNARRIIIKKDGRSVMEFPLSVGLGGAAAAILISPTLAAVGAFASLVSDVHIVVERVEPAGSDLISSPGEPGTPGSSPTAE